MFVRISWANQCLRCNLRYTRYTRAGAEVTQQREAVLPPIPFSAESLASAPNLRLRIIRLAIFRATNLGSKYFWDKHIELIRMLRPYLAPQLPYPFASG